MVGIIAPTKQFLISLKINNPSDAGTYYVRATIKNAISGETLETVNLTDQGDKYFSKIWMTPPDFSGTGLQIKIFKTVYTDAAYTQESAAYGTVVEDYIIRDLATRQLFGGGAYGLTKQEAEEIIEKALKGISLKQEINKAFELAEKEVRDIVAETVKECIEESLNFEWDKKEKKLKEDIANSLDEITSLFRSRLERLSQEELRKISGEIKEEMVAQTTFQSKEFNKLKREMEDIGTTLTKNIGETLTQLVRSIVDRATDMARAQREEIVNQTFRVNFEPKRLEKEDQRLLRITNLIR
jgi:DNA-directed RNA polymerase subunit F